MASPATNKRMPDTKMSAGSRETCSANVGIEPMFSNMPAAVATRVGPIRPFEVVMVGLRSEHTNLKLGDVLRIPARRTAAFCSRKPTVPASRLLTIRAIFLSDCAFGEPHEAWLRWRLPGARMSRTAFVGDQMTHGGQKGFGMTKHGRSGHATRSPRFRFLQKLEAQKNDRKDRSRIKDPKQSVEELFHPRKAT